MAIAELDLNATFDNVDDAESLSGGEVSFIDAARARTEQIAQRSPNRSGLLTSDPMQFSCVLKQLKLSAFLNGCNFCEWGSGIGMIAGLAAINEFHSYGIETDPILHEQATDLAQEFALNVVFARGSFVPADTTGGFSVRGTYGATDWAPSDEHDAYRTMGQPLSKMNLVYAYPWPREVPIYEGLFDMLAGPGAVLWLYRHGLTPKLLQKIS